MSVLYKHIIQVENKNVGLKVGGHKHTIAPPIKKVGGAHAPLAPPPPASYASVYIYIYIYIYMGGLVCVGVYHKYQKLKINIWSGNIIILYHSEKCCNTLSVINKDVSLL